MHALLRAELLDELMEKHQLSIRVDEEHWTSVVTISSTKQNIAGMYECRIKFLEILLPSLQEKKSK